MLKLNKLYNMECMEGMKQFPDKYFELAIVDPPYGIGAGKEKPHNGWKDYGIKHWDNQSPDKAYFEELFRVSQNQIIWGANHFISKISRDFSCFIIWDKGQRDLSNKQFDDLLDYLNTLNETELIKAFEEKLKSEEKPMQKLINILRNQNVDKY